MKETFLRNSIKILKFLISIVALLLLSSSTDVSAAPGDIDPTFGQNGRVFTRVGVTDLWYFFPNTESIRVQPDGKILVCGRFWEDGVSWYYGTFIVRYMPDGSLDPSFGTGGKVTVLDGFTRPAVGVDMALQADGKIVLLGDTDFNVVVRRYTPDGALDTTFGNGGTSEVNTGTAYESGMSIIVQPDGKIVGVGQDFWYFPPRRHAATIFRLNANGLPDTTFGPAGTGIVTIENGSSYGKAFIRSNGEIIYAGNYYRNGQATIVLGRYDSNGIPDPSFGTDGLVTHSLNGAETFLSSAAMQRDGKLVVAGRDYSVPGGRGYVARFNLDGSQDIEFGTDGVFNPSSFGAETVLIQHDGKIVLTGNGTANGISGFGLLRLTSSGVLDNAFGIDGISVFPMNAGGPNNAGASDGALQPDGKILITGHFGIYDSDNIALLRLDAEAPSVIISGRVITPSGLGLRSAVVFLTDSVGNRRSVLTSSLGFYSFADIPAGETVTIAATSRRYRFQAVTRTISESLSDVDLVGLE